MKKVERFASSVRAAISFDSPDLEDLEKLHDEGGALDVDVPELSNLKQVVEHSPMCLRFEFRRQNVLMCEKPSIL